LTRATGGSGFSVDARRYGSEGAGGNPNDRCPLRRVFETRSPS
jgi:hypothetical protein